MTATLANALSLQDVREIVEREARLALGAVDVRMVLSDEFEAGVDYCESSPVDSGERLSMPLTVSGVAGALGTLHVTFGDDPRGRRVVAEHAFVAAIADQCAQAIQRAQLRAAEHDAVVHLQRTLLAHTMDRSPHMVFSARYRPASSPLDVGGDWYDVIAVDRHRVMLIVGDVVGRGLQAAVTMAQVRSAARALALRSRPATLLHELDRYVAGLDDAFCTTVACVLVDPLAATLSYSVAGHPFPFVKSADGSVSMLEDGRSVPLGWQNAQRTEADHELVDGQLLLLYTDGLVERRGEHLDEGFARLGRALAEADLADPHWCDAVIDRCLSGTSQTDDVAVLGCQLQLAPIELRFELSDGLASLAPLRRSIRAWLADLDVAVTTVNDVLVAGVEAVSNAIIHGQDGPGAPPVFVARHHPGRWLSISVVGSGPWRAPGAHTRQGGRGLPLMGTLMDSVHIAATSEGGTEVRMTKRLAISPAPANRSPFTGNY